MPRIRNWKDLKFYRADKDTKYHHIDQLFSDTVDWDLIETHWQDLLQVVLSIKAGKILPSTLLRKLSNYSRKPIISSFLGIRKDCKNCIFA